MSEAQTRPTSQALPPTLATTTAHMPIESETILSIRQVHDVNLAPNGQQVAFTLEAFVADRQKAQAHIWIVETSAESEARPLTTGSQQHMQPRWAPDSRRIACVSTDPDDKEKPQLSLIEVQDATARRVCTMPNGVSDPQWAPDGSRIAFLSTDGEEHREDPVVVVPARHRRLWSVRPDFGIPEALTPANMTVWEYAWSPDGKQLALYYSTGPQETDWYSGQIGIVPSCGGAIHQISQLTGQASSLAWLPDGQRIVYITGNWSDRGLVGGDVWIQSARGGQARNLTPGGQTSLSWCRCFPDGKRLLYAAWSGVTHHIGILHEHDG
ncbi:MAG TPA: hypothetical protein VGF67_16005, partial [Ktedonobacteraceae bacterium]